MVILSPLYSSRGVSDEEEFDRFLLFVPCAIRPPSTTCQRVLEALPVFPTTHCRSTIPVESRTVVSCDNSTSWGARCAMCPLLLAHTTVRSTVLVTRRSPVSAVLVDVRGTSLYCVRTRTIPHASYSCTTSFMQRHKYCDSLQSGWHATHGALRTWHCAQQKRPRARCTSCYRAEGCSPAIMS